MTRTRIKICGVRTPAMASAAAEAGADAVGLVFVPASPRAVTQTQAKAVIAALPPFVEPVALFVNAPLDRVRDTACALGIATVQLHGDETTDYAAQLAPLRVIKAVDFAPQGLPTNLAKWRDSGNVIGLLWDTPPSEAARKTGRTGGAGHTFDWNALAMLRLTGVMDGLPPTILAGGLTPENVGQAVALIEPFAVDVSSGVESRRGTKDPRKIRAFCDAVHAADEMRCQHCPDCPDRGAAPGTCGRHAHV